MTYLKFDQSESGDFMSPFDLDCSIDDPISGLSRIGGYVVLIMACLAILALVGWFVS